MTAIQRKVLEQRADPIGIHAIGHKDTRTPRGRLTLLVERGQRGQQRLRSQCRAADPEHDQRFRLLLFEDLCGACLAFGQKLLATAEAAPLGLGGKVSVTGSDRARQRGVELVTGETGVRAVTE